MKILFSVLLLSLSVAVGAQCNYYYLQNNKTVTMGTYDKKGAQNGKCVYKISNVSKSGGTTSANVHSEVFDKKGKSIGGGAGNMQCKNGQLLMDMKMLMNPQQMQQFKNATVEGRGDYMEYPTSVSVGQQLSDASFSLDIKSDNGMPASMDMDITNRKVEAKEKVTIPAGSWEAYKITYNSKMTMTTMGIPIKMQMQMTEWFVPDFGIIKTESKWGKTELLSIE